MNTVLSFLYPVGGLGGAWNRIGEAASAELSYEANFVLAPMMSQPHKMDQNKQAFVQRYTTPRAWAGIIARIAAGALWVPNSLTCVIQGARVTLSSAVTAMHLPWLCRTAADQPELANSSAQASLYRNALLDLQAAYADKLQSANPTVGKLFHNALPYIPLDQLKRWIAAGATNTTRTELTNLLTKNNIAHNPQDRDTFLNGLYYSTYPYLRNVQPIEKELRKATYTTQAEQMVPHHEARFFYATMGGFVAGQILQNTQGALFASLGGLNAVFRLYAQRFTQASYSAMQFGGKTVEQVKDICKAASTTQATSQATSWLWSGLGWVGSGLKYGIDYLPHIQYWMMVAGEYGQNAQDAASRLHYQLFFGAYWNLFPSMLFSALGTLTTFPFGSQTAFHSFSCWSSDPTIQATCQANPTVQWGRTLLMMPFLIIVTCRVSAHIFDLLRGKGPANEAEEKKQEEALNRAFAHMGRYFMIPIAGNAFKNAIGSGADIASQVLNEGWDCTVLSRLPK